PESSVGVPSVAGSHVLGFELRHALFSPANAFVGLSPKIYGASTTERVGEVDAVEPDGTGPILRLAFSPRRMQPAGSVNRGVVLRPERRPAVGSTSRRRHQRRREWAPDSIRRRSQCALRLLTPPVPAYR